MNDFLEASDGYVPLLIFVLTGVVILILAVIFRGSLATVGRDVVDGKRGVKVKGAELMPKAAITSMEDQKRQQPQSVVMGDSNQMALLFKAVGDGFKKSTKAMQVDGGCLVQVSTEVQSSDGSWSAAEALEFVPGVRVVRGPDGPDGPGRSLGPAE